MRYRNVKLKYPTIYKMLHYNITQHSTFTHYFITLEYFTTVGAVKKLCNPFMVLGRTPKDYIRLRGERVRQKIALDHKLATAFLEAS